MFVFYSDLEPIRNICDIISEKFDMQVAILNILCFWLSTVAKNEADRQAEKREIKRRLTRKVCCPSVWFQAVYWVRIFYLSYLIGKKWLTWIPIDCYKNKMHDANMENNTALSRAF